MWRFALISIVLLGMTSAFCPQNLGPCLCTRSPNPTVGPILDCSKVVEPNDFADIIGLTSRPPARFSKFIIRRSQLTELPSEALGVIHADEYIIENNPLMESIIQGALGVNANPKVISIRNNPLLEDIPFEDFKSFSNLEIVNMQDNRILDVPDFAFDGISNKLREINFQRNVILDVGVFAFRNLPALETIDLSQNQLGELGASSLFFTTAPRVVNLSGNRIANLDADTFTNPNQPSTGAYVKTLDLSNNAISRLNYADIEPIFRRLDALKMSADPPTTTTTAPPFNPFAQQGFGQQPFGFQNQQQNPFAALQQQHPQQQPSVPSLLGGGIPTPVEPPTQPPPPPVPSPTEPQIPITRPTAAAAANPFGSNDLLQRIFERLSQLTGAGVAPTTTEPPTTTTQAPTTTTEPPAPVSTTEDAAKLIFKLRQELLQAIKSNPTAAAAAGNAVLAAAQAAQTKPKKKSKSSADPLVDAATESPAANAVRRKRQAPNLTAEQLRSFFPGGQLPPGLVALFGQQGAQPQTLPQPQPRALGRQQQQQQPGQLPTPFQLNNLPSNQRITNQQRPNPFQSQPSNPFGQPQGQQFGQPQAQQFGQPQGQQFGQPQGQQFGQPQGQPQGQQRGQQRSQLFGQQEPGNQFGQQPANQFQNPFQQNQFSQFQQPNSIPTLTKPDIGGPQYTVNLQGNPFMCDCESKWLYDFRLKYADQIFGLTCIENGQNVFTLPETHFTQC